MKTKGPNRSKANVKLGSRFTAAFGLACLLLFPMAAMAQGVSGRILGTVVDPSGAVVANAAITVTNMDTGVVTKSATNSSGQYLINDINPGPYSVAVQAPGFSKEISTGDVVVVDHATAVNFTVRVGQASTTVHVTGGRQVIDTTESSMGEVIGEKTLQAVPLSGNYATQIINTVPGAVADDGNGEAAESGSGTGAKMPITAGVNGIGPNLTTLTLDGVSDMEVMDAFMNVIPPLDAIQQVSISTNDADPSVGTYGGAQINIIVKSGTNQIHGSAYEFYRGDVMEATPWVNQGPITQVPAVANAPWTSNQFGGSIGGPIIKNKLFYFGDFQALLQGTGTTFVGSEPPPLVRAGIFTESPGGMYAYPIYVPNSYNPSTGSATPWGYSPGTDITAPGMPPGAYIGGCPSAAPADSQCIPQSDWDPVAEKIVSNTNFWPTAKNPNSREDNYSESYIEPESTYQFDVKIDYQINSRNHIFGRESYQANNLLEPGVTDFDGEGVDSWPRDHNADIGWDHLFSATATNQLRVGLNRFYTTDQAPDEGSNEDNALGIENGDNPAVKGAQGLTYMTGTEYDSLGDSNGWTNSQRITNVYEVDDHFMKTLGRQVFTFGEDARRMETSLTNANNLGSGEMSFGADMTSACAGSGNGTCVSYAGSGFASFLLGVPDELKQSFVDDKPNTWTNIWGLYGSDDYRITRNLTLNLALRWDVITNIVESHNHLSNWDPTTGLMDLATPGNRRANVNNYYGAVLPTIGFAYAMNHDRTVIRGAYGMTQFTQPYGGTGGGSLEENYPWFSNLAGSESEANTPWASVSPNNPYVPAGTHVGMYLPPVITGTEVNGQDTVTIPASTTTYYTPRYYHSAEEYDWNFGVEQKLGPTTGFTLSYVGTKGMHLYERYNINSILPGGSYAYPYGSLDPQLPNNIDELNSEDWSIWQAMEAELRQNFSHGLQGRISYTWSDERDDSGPTYIMDPYDWALDTGDFLRRPRDIVGDVIYQLPFGKGQHWLTGSGPLSMLGGGWQLSSIFNLQSGLPLQFFSSFDALQTDSQIGDYAEKTCSHVPKVGSVNEWFDTSCYTNPALEQIGNSGADSVSAPGYTNFDMSLAKNTPIGMEGRKLQFTVEASNVFNHPQLGTPDTSIYDKLNPNGNGQYEFGSISGSTGIPRMLQAGVHYTF